MIRNYQDFKPVKAGAQIFIFLGFLFFAISYFPSDGAGYDSDFVFFIWANILWYLIMGVGILYQKIWGFYMLKIWLYTISLGIPIGTYIGIKSLRYIKEKNIKDFFVGKSLDF